MTLLCIFWGRSDRNNRCLFRWLLLLNETCVESVCRKLFAEAGAVQGGHRVVVNECHTVYASLIGVSENDINITLFELGNKIIFA